MGQHQLLTRRGLQRKPSASRGIYLVALPFTTKTKRQNERIRTTVTHPSVTCNADVTPSLTMSSKQIAAVVEKRHDNVKRTIENLANQGVISFTQIEETSHQIEDGEKAANGVFASSVALIGIESDL